MTGAEKGFLLLGSRLGNPERKPLTTAQLRRLAARVRNSNRQEEDRQLQQGDLMKLGYADADSRHILALLEEEELLERYLCRSKKVGCVPICWISKDYPGRLQQCLADESPAVLWAKGNLQLLEGKKVALVGSRDIRPENSAFAAAVGKQAALQGYTLVSGNARGADRIAQHSCLKHGGNVICVVADELDKQPVHERVLYLSEEDFDAEFSAQRALSRNRVIHALADRVFVAQSNLAAGGTWDGTVRNLRYGWSDVFCFDDGTEAMLQLVQMGAQSLNMKDLEDFSKLYSQITSFFDQ